MRQAGAEDLLLDSGAQLHACPIEYPGQRVPLPDPGLHTASGARLQIDGRTIRVIFHACDIRQPILSLGCLAQQGCWSDLRADTGTLFFPDRTQTQQTQPNTVAQGRSFVLRQREADGTLGDGWCE